MFIVRNAIVIVLALLTGFALPYCYAYLDISYVQEVQVWLVTNKPLLNFFNQYLDSLMAEQAMYWLVTSVTAGVYALMFGAVLGLVIGFIGSGRLFFYLCLWYPLVIFISGFLPQLQELKIQQYSLSQPIQAIGHNWQGILIILFVLFWVFFAIFNGFSAPQPKKDIHDDYLL